MLTDGIDHVATITDDADRLKAFYAHVFGATVERDGPEFPGGPRMVILNLGPSTELNVFEIDGNTEYCDACFRLASESSADAGVAPPPPTGVVVVDPARPLMDPDFLLAVNLLLLAFGLFMDPLPGVMILVPILAPISFALGIDPNHFAIIVIVNLTLGLTTPPVGSLIFVVSSTVHLKPSTLIRELPPFFLALAAALLLITFVPSLSTWLPAVSGF